MKHAACLFLFAVTLLNSCYHLGNPGGRSVAIDAIDVTNATNEPALAKYVIASLKEHAVTTPGIRLCSKGEPSFDIRVKLQELDHRSLSRSKLRDKVSRDDDGDAYQTVLFRVTLKAQVTVTTDNEDKPVIDKPYTAYADIPKMHDRDIPFQHALQQAANTLALQIVNDIAAR